jgi:hypothetical protein
MVRNVLIRATPAAVQIVIQSVTTPACGPAVRRGSTSSGCGRGDLAHKRCAQRRPPSPPPSMTSRAGRAANRQGLPGTEQRVERKFREIGADPAPREGVLGRLEQLAHGASLAGARCQARRAVARSPAQVATGWSFITPGAC